MEISLQLSLPQGHVEQNSIENSVLRMLLLIALAEKAVKADNQCIWFQNEELNKRRKKYQFDNHLQHMIDYCKQIGVFRSRVVECGTKSYYKSELYYVNGQKEIIIHIHSSFNQNAQYNHKYLDMNATEKRYAYIEYRLDKERETVQSLTWVVPDARKKEITLDLLPFLNITRDFIQSQKLTIQEMVHQINTMEY